MLDDEQPSLAVVVNPSMFSEGAGVGAATGTVARTGSTASALVVSLSSSDTGEATVPATVTIQAGHTSATFQVNAIDDLVLDGTQAVTITASAAGFDADSDTVSVTDDEMPSLSLVVSPDSFVETAGTGAATGTVTRTGSVSSALVVNLSSDDTDGATVPSTVIIPSGQTSATFQIAAIDDAILDGTQVVTITASATGYNSGSDAIQVTDNEAFSVAPSVQDFNDDGSSDLARMDAGGQWLVTTSQGTTEVWGHWSTAVTWQDVQYADVNGDGQCDVIGRTDGGSWWAGISDGSSFTNQYMGGWAPINWNDVQAADVTGDGKADVIGRTDTGAWWAGISNGSNFTNQFMGGWAPITWNDVQAADVNGDGKADVVGRTDTGGWWAGVSDGSNFTNQFMGAWAPITWNDVQIGDVNNDGKADVVGRTAGGQWWAAVSSGSSFTNQYMGGWSSGVTWQDVQVGDFNNDGKDDVIGRTTGGQWWAGLSDGSSFANQYLGSWSSSVTWEDVRILDLDGDGKDDVLGCILTTDDWWAGLSDGSDLTNVFWA